MAQEMAQETGQGTAREMADDLLTLGLSREKGKNLVWKSSAMSCASGARMLAASRARER